jgi:hypothetical protein
VGYDDYPYAYDYAYDDDYGYRCRYYNVRWHQTGSRYWLRRYEECMEDY